MGRLRRIFLVVTSLMAAVTACGGERACDPGETQLCVCPGAAVGAQTCGADGRSWSACVCPGEGVSPTVDAGVGRDVSITVDVPSATDAGLLPADLERGAEVFSTYCAGCHGPGGRGTDDGPDLAGEAREHSDRSIAETILEGEDDMPPQRLEPQQVVDVIAYLRSLFGAPDP